jgi:predicted nucleotidyltransferase
MIFQQWPHIPQTIGIPGRSFLNLENYLSDTLGIKVDPVMKAALKLNIGRHILNEVEAV